MGFLFRNGICAGIAYQEAGLAAHACANLGLAAAVLMLVFICLTNNIAGHWLKGDHHV